MTNNANQLSASPGAWKSPLSAEEIVKKANTPAGIIHCADHLYIIESRPGENGRNALFKIIPGSAPQEALPANFNIRSRVHEYGGSCTTVGNENEIFFCNFSDQRIYRLIPGSEPSPITSEAKLRFACLEYDKRRQLIFAVMEDHTKSDLEPENSIVSIDPFTGKIEKICQGHDFYAFPRLSKDGSQLAYICWNHPAMPWDATELFIVDLDQHGRPGLAGKIAGNGQESITQPEWHEDGLLYISDINGWWNLYSFKDGESKILFEKDCDFAKPMWSIGARSFTPIDRGNIFVTWCSQAQWQAGILNIASSKLETLDLPYNSYTSMIAVDKMLYFIGSSFTTLPEVVAYNLQNSSFETLFASGEIPVAPDYVSVPESIEFEAAPGEMVQAFYYPPKNPDYKVHEPPPLLVTSHGGPTGAAGLSFALSTQFWTTRGFAVVDVNYSGSSGFGRKYRDRLKANWGIKDVRDCEKAAIHLVNAGLADPNKIAIRGGSAGGFTTLCALTFTNTFQAGASHFGLSDLEILAKETHKFESRYMDSLIGPYPESIEIYRQRSPINHIEKLSCPVIFFQGLDDKVVPPNQAERMYRILCEKGFATAYVAYEGEGHGFRKAENIKHSLEAELYFFQQIFALNPESSSGQIEIINFKGKTNA